MTTTQILFDPYASAAQANGYSRYDLEGTIKDTLLNETFVGRANAFASGVGEFEKGNHRINNNTYDWVVGLTSSFTNNDHKIILDATNWPLDSNANVTISNVGVATITSQDYTFPGGGTISGNNRGIAVRGRYLANRAYDFGDNILVEYSLNTHQGNVATVYARSPDVALAAAPGYGYTTVSQEAVYQYGPYNTYYITPSQNTAANVKFFAHAGHRVRSLGDSEGTGYLDTSLEFFYDYEWRNVWEVNLHSATTTAELDSEIGQFVSEIADYFEASYVDADYVQQETELQFRPGVLAEILYAGSMTVTATADLEPVAAACAVTATADLSFAIELETVGGQLITGEAVLAIDSDSAFTLNQIATGNCAIEIESSFDPVVPGLLPGGSVDAVIEVASETTAINRVFTLALDYVDPDYADTGYFEQSSTATDTFTTQIDSAMLADSSVIASDGSILLEADFDTTVVAGFQVSGGVILAADAALDIAPYITGGTGVIRAAAATLTDEFVVPDLFLGQAVELQADLAIEFVAAGFASITRGIQDQLEIALELSAQAIAAPPLLGTATLAIDLTTADTVPGLFPGFASPSILETGPSTLEAFAGYTIFGQFAVTQGINADFVVAGSTFRIDDYFTSVVTPESRSIRVNAATGQITVDTETRVNTIQVETRGLVVEPETRRDRIAINPAVLEGNRLRRYNQ